MIVNALGDHKKEEEQAVKECILKLEAQRIEDAVNLKKEELTKSE